MSEQKTRRISMLWVLPIIAFAISAYALWQYKQEKGDVIKIAFPNAEGIKIGKTEVKYNGIPIGKVIDLDVTDDLKNVLVIVELIQPAFHFAREGSQFWLVRPKISLHNVRNLQTIVSGVYIAALPPAGTKKDHAIGEKQLFFYGEDEPDAIVNKEKSTDLKINIRVDEAFSLKTGASVSYKGVEVGFVREIDIASDGSHINACLNIGQEHAYLVRENSLFWNQGSFRIRWGLRGIKVQGRPLDTIIGGGIAFATPEKEPGERVINGHIFELEPEVNPKWYQWDPVLN